MDTNRSTNMKDMGLGTGPVTIRAESPAIPEVRALIEASQAALLSHLPPEEIFSLDHAALAAPNVTLFVARLDGQAAGCVALVDALHHGEIKRLYVRDSHRGLGIGSALMQAAERFCSDIGLTEIRLESSPSLTAAARLYETLGYTACAPFGDYPVLDSSLFMAKTVSPLASRLSA